MRHLASRKDIAAGGLWRARLEFFGATPALRHAVCASASVLRPCSRSRSPAPAARSPHRGAARGSEWHCKAPDDDEDERLRMSRVHDGGRARGRGRGAPRRPAETYSRVPSRLCVQNPPSRRSRASLPRWPLSWPRPTTDTRRGPLPPVPTFMGRGTARRPWNHPRRRPAGAMVGNQAPRAATVGQARMEVVRSLA